MIKGDTQLTSATASAWAFVQTEFDEDRRGRFNVLGDEKVENAVKKPDVEHVLPGAKAVEEGVDVAVLGMKDAIPNSESEHLRAIAKVEGDVLTKAVGPVDVFSQIGDDADDEAGEAGVVL